MYHFKNNPKRVVLKAPWGKDQYYSQEGQYRIYQTIDSSKLEKDGEEPSGKGISRRQVLKYGGVFGAGAVLASTIMSYFLISSTRENGKEEAGKEPIVEPVPVRVSSFPRKRIATLGELEEGNPIDFKYPSDHFNNTSFIVKLGTRAIGGIGSDADIVSFNYMCTHMGCSLVGQYKHDFKMLGPCPCHYTRFDLTKNGMVIIGQATENLPQILLEIEGEEVFATGVMRLIYGFRSNLADVEVAQ